MSDPTPFHSPEPTRASPEVPGAQGRRSRTPLVLAAGAAVLAVGIGATLPFVLDDGSDVVGTGSTSSAGGEQSPSKDLAAVEVFDDLPTTHTDEKVDYAQSPPVGGPHLGVWLDCGVFDDPVPDEMAVHDLEHGAFWFTYDPDELDDDEVATLEARLPSNAIMSPYPGLRSPVVVTVWERQLALTGVDDVRLGLFLEEFAGGTTAPEPFASCAGGATEAELDALRGVVPS
ncbi:DUF3105 domain-containing protein [Nocardioides sp. R-C-SC26]|uniref:DUF3105 domain-containing protein n=1 Tax=Nocardioides sp. R-C-SC26 TaxID=2870414 RepID=UPI001E5082CC|nr:DUF3105 domain-containing protein [Nocardioides sp. R-C-SC26]